ncbi:hypothetical protein LASUN_02400 [Lentilactobacillus sunkii]|jgi:adenylosuccinate lyase|uniref:Surface layer protein A domain-containing protein n=1 Tax=Lentilactobacillus sunkii TaxID=481719 RepID=A0A1E7XJH1_9LACO|nr:hypothetical protein [Lentilactobacillus sunkii]OFA13241.1 hypothetical protein LASUN_02400 [Lentilactobacillus sunkii]
MKKFATMITVASLALPLAFAAPLAVSAATTPVVTTAAKTKGTTYTIAKNGVKNFKAKSYHIKKNIPLYKGFFYADSGKVTFTRKGKLTKAVTYKVTRSVKVSATKTSKAKTFLYVKGYGYVLSTQITKGIYMPAD